MAKAVREVYGETLVELAGSNNDIVVLDADLAGSTKSGIFQKAYPDRFFNMGIAEANMAATAAGLAAGGKIPFINTFAAFMSTLSLVAVRSLICYGGFNVKLAGAYCGLSDAFDGASHHAIEDIAIMRSLANMTVICPSDAASTRAAVRFAIDKKGPVYMRLSRDVYPDLYDHGADIDMTKGAIVRDGTDVTVVACGIMVHNAVEAANRLKAEGVSVRVVDIRSIKPIDTELLWRCARETGAVVAAEEHNIVGGLGGAVAEALVRSDCRVPVEFCGVDDRYTESGPYKELLNKYGLDSDGVAAKIRAVLKRK